MAGGIAGVLPFLMPYKEFLVGYMTGFVQALQNTFGMGTNGYLMVIIFAYIGGLIADQTRRELFYKSGSSQSVGFNLIQPLFGGRHAVAEDADAYEEDDELVEMRRPVRARARGRGHGQVEIHTGPVRSRRRRHGNPDRFEEYRRLDAESAEGRSTHRHTRARERDEEDEAEDEDGILSKARHSLHGEARDHRTRAHDAGEDAEEEAPRREAAEGHRPRQRSHDEVVAIQRFVERALKHYEHPTR
jgi:hypothetical protein